MNDWCDKCEELMQPYLDGSLSDEQVAEKSAIARNFLDARTRLNENVDRADNFLVKRFYNIDLNTYLEGALPSKYKELMGLVASACLRCDDCINYHIIQSYRLGVTSAEQEEAIQCRTGGRWQYRNSTFGARMSCWRSCTGKLCRVGHACPSL